MKYYLILCVTTLSALEILSKKAISSDNCTETVREGFHKFDTANGIRYKLHNITNCQVITKTEYIIKTNADIEDPNGRTRFCVLKIREPYRPRKNDTQMTITCENEVIKVKSEFFDRVIDPRTQIYYAKNEKSRDACEAAVRKSLMNIDIVNGIKYKLRTLYKCKVTTKTEHITKAKVDIENPTGIVQVCIVKTRRPPRSDPHGSQMTITCDNEVIEFDNTFFNSNYHAGSN